MRSLVPLLLAGLCLVAFFLVRVEHVEHGPKKADHVSTMALDFPGATEFALQPECTNVDENDPCAGEWHHKSGQRVRVLVLPVPDKQKLADLPTRIEKRVAPEGGVVSSFVQNEQRVIRVLRPVKDQNGDALIVIEYILVSPDEHTLHMVTSSAPLADQETADTRVRDLLAFAAWVTP